MKKQVQILALLIGSSIYGQVGIGTVAPNKSAQLEIVSNNKGLLIPKVALTSLTDTSTITSGNVEGLTVYNTSEVSGLKKGYYYWLDNKWNRLITGDDVNVLANNTTNASLIKDGTDLKLIDSEGNSVSIPLTDITGGVVDTNTTTTGFGIVGTNLVITDSDGNTVSTPLSGIATSVNTDDQTITDFSIVGTNLSITLENGNTATVPLSNIAAGVNTDNQTVTDFSIVGTNLSITLENGNTATVPLSNIAAGVDTTVTNTSFAVVGTNLVITDSAGNTVSTPLATIAAGVNTDDQTVTDFSIVGTNLSITLENGNTATVPLSNIAAGVDTTVTNASFAVVGTNLVITDSAGNTVSTPLATIAAGVNTDDQTVTDFSVVGNNLSITIEDGNTATVPLATIATGVNTDDQTVTDFSVVGTNLSITLEDGNTATVPLATIAAGVDTNTTNSTFTVVGTNLVITDSAGGTVSVPLASIAAGVDTTVTNSTFTVVGTNLVITDSAGGTVSVPLATIAAGVNTDDQTVTDFSVVGTNLSITLEDGNTATVPLASIAAGVDTTVTNSTFTVVGTNLVITDSAGGTVSVPLATIAAGVNTDDQTVTDFSVVGNNLSITLEDGNTATVPLATIATGVNTDDQALTLATGNILTLEDGGTVDLTPFLDNTDDQAITATLNNTTRILTITLEDGGTQTVDFSTVLTAAGSDDQALTLATGNILTLEDGGTVDLTPFLDNTDDQAITATLNNTTRVLTITLEDGGTQTVDFSTVLAAAGTDDQALTLATGNILTLEDGGTVDLTPFLDNTDDQAITATLDNITKILTITLEDGGTQTVDFSTVLTGGGTDDQTVTNFGVVGTDLSITIEDGNTATVPLATIATGVNTDDQALTLATGNILTLEDGGTVDLTPFLDNTDDQAITATLDNTTRILTITLEDGGTQTVDFSTVLTAAGTDDQALTLATGNILTLEDGGTVDLTPFLDNTDDQAITATLDNTTRILTITLEDGGTQTVDFSTVLAAAGSDDQALTLATGNILTLEDGGTVDLTPFLDNTDDQAITATLDNTTKILTITLEDGGTQTVDFSTVLAAAGTDDQALTLATGNILTLEDGGTVDLTPFLDNTDDQTITNFGVVGTDLSITLEDGNTATVPLSALDNITGKALTSTDLDISANGATALLEDVTIDIKTDAVTTNKILNETILSEDIKNGEVKTDDIADKNVTVAKIANGTANQVLMTNAVGTDAEWRTVNNTVKEVLSAEYAGATLYADGTNNLGVMTSDNTGASGNFMNFYEWYSSEATAQDYDIVVRFTLPNDFTSWDATNPIVIDYQAEGATTFSATMFLENGTALGTIAASSSATWTTANLNPGAMTAGDTAVILLKLTSAAGDGTQKVRVGDITLNYTK
ncbi:MULTISPECIES: beta strand repeat-containing protein [unclassified Tenacibaculum]|uniref:beta strand repeat-containing protein n=1 Tax=unclassified Tenacibaculum TaxID=2635139 RepID=UPI001F315160|nr:MULTISPECIES: hypothetical protein [unclassified Tenacibaculum]MCF2873694.1 hypothetical protein [Tenacibaculum sp. Cn5-1]MCF2933850.1 hypothetical protein [Tenacibaculum sp. Cn5-34]MCG7509568.1 hypothetical protein [Tenacibaculum sp. Cn5-46]